MGYVLFSAQKCRERGIVSRTPIGQSRGHSGSSSRTALASCAVFLNEFPYFYDIPLKAGQDVFIVGYPFGQMAGTPLPIWKRGSIASEPHVPIDGLHKLFVDTASRVGMSGSFVVAQHNEAFTPPEKTTMFGGARKLLGIYSGRVAPSVTEAQLGIVWHRLEIDKAVKEGKPAAI